MARARRGSARSRPAARGPSKRWLRGDDQRVVARAQRADRRSPQRRPRRLSRSRSCRSRVRLRSVRTSTTRTPDGAPSCGSQVVQRSGQDVRRPRRSAERRRGRRRAVCRRPARRPPRAPARPARASVNSPPPSSLTTTIVRSGRGSSGPITSPVLSCRNVRSPISAYAGAAVAESGARRRWRPCRRCPRRRGWRAPAAARLPGVGEVEVADRARRPGDEQPAGRARHAATTRGHREAGERLGGQHVGDRLAARRVGVQPRSSQSPLAVCR